MNHTEMVAPAASSSSRNRLLLIATVYASMFVFGMVLFLMGALLPSLHVTSAQAGSLGSIPLLGILAATVVVGPILDTAGTKQVFATALILITTALAAMPSLHSYWQLALAAAMYGFGGGLLNTATNVLISELNEGKRARALNLLGFSFSLGAVASPLMSVSGLSAENVLHVLAAATAIVLVCTVILRFPPPLKPGESIRNVLAVLRQPAVWIFGMLLFFESANENCMFVWSSKIVADRLEVVVPLANLALLGLSASLGIGRLLAILWLRWLGNLGTIWFSAAVILVGSLLTVISHGLADMIAGIAVIGLGLSAVFPTALAVVGDYFPNQTGTVFGAIMTVALIGGSSGPTVASLAAAHGPMKVLWIPTVCAIAVAALTAVITRYKISTARTSSLRSLGDAKA